MTIMLIIDLSQYNLLTCTDNKTMASDTWTKAITLLKKIYGSLEGLHDTVAFIEKIYMSN